MATGISAPNYPHMRFQWLWLLVGSAWVVAVAATLTGQRFLIDHHFLLEESGLPWPLAASVFLIGWQVMIVAMMAPSSIPFAGASVAATADGQGGQHPHRALAIFFVAYGCAWTVFGALAFAGDTLIHHEVDAWPWLAAHSFLIGATTFALAGLYQFSRGKSISLARCRVRHMRVTGEPVGAATSPWRLGLRHGADSIGCCWALMLIMFGIGVGELGWMAALAMMMLSETAIPGETRSRRAREAIGVALFILAGLWLAHPAWLVPATVS
jgi:predicted metal-binding membrane protein